MAAVVGGGNPRLTLQEYAGKVRLAVQGRYGDVQFLRDEAVTMAGREVWLMVYDHPQKGVIDADHDDPKTVQRLAHAACPQPARRVCGHARLHLRRRTSIHLSATSNAPSIQ
ncbi:MAG: hypothetical protein QM770_12935 [Tepidisphaeraceae bacterium]